MFKSTHAQSVVVLISVLLLSYKYNLLCTVFRRLLDCYMVNYCTFSFVCLIWSNRHLCLERCNLSNLIYDTVSTNVKVILRVWAVRILNTQNNANKQMDRRIWFRRLRFHSVCHWCSAVISMIYRDERNTQFLSFCLLYVHFRSSVYVNYCLVLLRPTCISFVFLFMYVPPSLWFRSVFDFVSFLISNASWTILSMK